MLHYPDVYRKAQEEIDRVIGNERLPDLTDRYSLPYLEALVMESYRCVTSYNFYDPSIFKIAI
jgi:cytochrome P450